MTGSGFEPGQKKVTMTEGDSPLKICGVYVDASSGRPRGVPEEVRNLLALIAREQEP